MFYYNKDAFRAAGLDPDQPPRTLGEVRSMAEKLLVKDGGQVTQYGYVSAVDGWLVEQWFAKAGQTYCNNGNGREGRATEVTWDNPVLHDILGFWHDIVADGVAMNAGRVNGDAISAFVSGRAASLVMTSAPMRDIIDRSEFEVGVANFPSPVDDPKGSVFNGGASIWLLKGHPEAEQAAALEFIKFLGSADAQGQWSAGTGYIPTNIHAAEADVYKDIVAKYPDFDKPRQQLETAAQSVASSGCLVGVLPQARPRLNEAIDSVLLGGDIEEAITSAQTAVNDMIANYNRSVGE
jgi:sn-glycerol 3-phosphate transport system substrate-binding protein